MDYITFNSKIKSNGFLHLIMTYVFFIAGFITNMFQAIIYVTIRPFSKNWYRKFNKYLCDIYYELLVFVADWWGSIELKVYMDKYEFDTYFAKEHAFGIMNHTYVVDWLTGMLVLRRKGIIGNAKAFAKKTISYIPAIGWCWRFSEWFFLDRNYERDKDKIESHVNAFTEYRDPIWVVLYPEGTRLKPYRLDSSQKYARSKGYTVLKHHLFPRTKGFVETTKLVRGKMGAVYHVVLGFTPEEKHKATFFSLLNGNKITAHLYIKRITFDQIPEDDEGCAKFLRDMFVEKDKMLDSFLNTGDFFIESGVKSEEPISFNRSFSTVLVTLMWSVISLTPVCWIFIEMIKYNGGFFFIISLILAYYIIYVFVCHLLSNGSVFSQSTTSKKHWTKIQWESTGVVKHIEKKIKIF